MEWQAAAKLVQFQDSSPTAPAPILALSATRPRKPSKIYCPPYIHAAIHGISALLIEEKTLHRSGLKPCRVSRCIMPA